MRLIRNTESKTSRTSTLDVAVPHSMWERLVLYVEKERPLIFADPENDTGEITIVIPCLSCYSTVGIPTSGGNMFIIETYFHERFACIVTTVLWI